MHGLIGIWRRGEDDFLVVDGDGGEDIDGGDHNPVENRRPGARGFLLRRVVEGLNKPAWAYVKIAVGDQPEQQSVVVEPVDGQRRDQHMQRYLKEVAKANPVADEMA